jgi:fatty-acyl-CoA synthase
MSIVAAILDRGGGPGTLTVLGGGPRAQVVSWARLHQQARRMAAVLAGAGTGRGGRVGLLADPSTDLVAALQAVWLAGASVTVLPRPAAAHLLRPVLADAGLDLVVVAAEPAGGSAAALAPIRVLTLAELVRRAEGTAPAAVRPPDPADLAVLQYTSGSTRSPRGVPVTHRHLTAQLDALREALHPELDHPRPMLSWLPLHHDMGLIGFLAFPMAGGHPLVLQPPTGFVRRPASWLEAVSRHRSVVTGAPDFAYRVVTPLLEAGLVLDLSTVRLMLSGGEPISAGSMRRFLAAAARYGLDPGAVVAAYGLAEATLAVTCARPGTGLTTDSVDPDRLERDGRAVPPRPGGRVRTLARLGWPVPGTRLRIVDRHTRAPAGAREVGEVEVQGGPVVGHYWREPPPAADAWLPTGDLGYLADGDLVVCGRSKDVLFAAGRNLYPADIELAAGRVPGVRPGGAVAFGVPSEQGDRLVVAVETRDADRAGLRRAVTVAVTAETGMRPAQVLALPPGRLPRTTSGKLRRAEARRRYVAGELAGGAARTRPTTLQEGHSDEHLDHAGAGRVARAGRTGGRPARGVPAGARGTT